MPDLPRSHLLAYGLALLAVVGFGLRQVARSAGAGAPAGDPVPAATGAGPDGRASAPAASGRKVVVHVAGLVRRPGVYRLADGARVQDAVRRAGGARRGADLSALNLAAELEDGRQVLVPPRAGAAAPSAAGATGGGGVTGGGAAGGGVAAGGASAAGGGAAAGAATAGLGAATGPPVNLNTATLEQLDTLDGVGPVTAQKILAYRQERGGFGSVDELGEIPGIGPKRMETLRELVTV